MAKINIKFKDNKLTKFRMDDVKCQLSSICFPMKEPAERNALLHWIRGVCYFTFLNYFDSIDQSVYIVRYNYRKLANHVGILCVYNRARLASYQVSNTYALL